MTSVIKTNCQKYVELQKTIKDLRVRMKEFRDATAIVENSIVTWMKENDQFILKLEDSGKVFELVSKDSKKTMSSKVLKEKLTEANELEGEAETKEAIEKIMEEIDNMPVVTKESLKCK